MTETSEFMPTEFGEAAGRGEGGGGQVTAVLSAAVVGLLFPLSLTSSAVDVVLKVSGGAFRRDAAQISANVAALSKANAGWGV